MHKVFVSYSSKEADRANEIVKQLEAAGIPCWIAPRDIGIGSNYTEDIPSAIEDCKHFMLILSPASQDSYWVNKELSYAISLRNEILPIQIEDFPIARRLRFQLADVQVRDYCANPQGVLREVIRLFPKVTPTTTAHVPAPTPKPASAAPPSNPVRDKKLAEEYFQKGEKAYYAQQYADAVNWYRKAAEYGHGDAQWSLGYCYEMGNGVTKTLVEAANWYRKAADQGYTSAQFNLGLCYEFSKGVEKNLVEAANWYRKAADQGHASAQCNLGYCYSNGNGVEQNRVEAVKWYRKAADQGLARAQCNLGLVYQYGRGVSKDLNEAKKWFQKAADQGDEDAQKALASLK